MSPSLEPTGGNIKEHVIWKHIKHIQNNGVLCLTAVSYEQSREVKKIISYVHSKYPTLEAMQATSLQI